MKSILSMLLAATFLFCSCGDIPSERNKRKREDRKETISNLYNAFALAGAFQSKDPCTDENWTRISTFYIGYIVLYDSNRSKIDCAGVSIPTTSYSHTYNTDGSQITTATISQQTPRIPLQCRHVKSTNPTYSENSWYRQDANNTRNANFVFKHILQKDANGNTIGMDSFVKYDLGDILYCCDQPNQRLLCDKIQIN